MENRDMPAYPQSVAANEVGIYLATSANISDKAQVVGLTKREMIAAMALQGLLANPNVKFRTTTENFVRISIEITDALLLELSKSHT